MNIKDVKELAVSARKRPAITAMLVVAVVAIFVVSAWFSGLVGQLGARTVAPPNSSSAEEILAAAVSVRYSVEPEEFGAVIAALRSERGLRELATVESGKRLREIPQQTYFFTFGDLIDSRYRPVRFDDLPVFRFRQRSLYELHYPRGSELMLIVFMTDIDATEITMLSGKEDHEVLTSPIPWGSVTALVSLPTSRIQSARQRNVELEPGKSATVVDLVIR